MPGFSTSVIKKSAWICTFSDDFDGVANSAPDPTKWNNPDDDNDFPSQDAKLTSANAYLDGNSNLVIRAQQESIGGASWSSAQISTAGKFQQAYGKFEFRAQMPAGGGGIWPALWLLGANWPHNGEIDVLEMFGGTMDTAQMYYHYWDGSGPASTGTSYFDSALTTGFHIFVVEWDPGEVRWYIDGILRRTLTDSVVSSSQMWILIDMYLGGPFAPVTATFPQYMLVDYVRVWKRR